DEDANDKKSGRNKKANKQQQNPDHADGTIDDLLTVPSTSSTNTDSQELSTPTNFDQSSAFIPVRNHFSSIIQ
ncbi:unnamed protein product, partial [Rotaria magnacalcarata]